MPDPGRDSVVEAAPAATPAEEGHAEADAGQEGQAQGPDEGPARGAQGAVAEVRSQGFTTLELDDYDPKATCGS